MESVVLQLNGHDLESAFGFYTPKDAETITDNVQLSVREDGSIQVAFPEASTEEAILASLEEVVPAAVEEAEAISTEDIEAAGIPPIDTAEADTSAPEPAAAEPTVETTETAETEVPEVVAESTPSGPAPAYLTNPTHHALPLPSPSFTFAVSKRVLQLTGHQIPDAVLTRAKTVGDLLPSLITPPKPKKLSEELEPLLEELPNVRLFEKKRVGLDKEMELGRARKVDAKEVYRYKGIDPERGYIGEKPYTGDVNKNFY